MWLGSIVALFTAVMLAGWLIAGGFGSDTSVLGQMKANTAFGLLLGACSLLLVDGAGDAAVSPRASWPASWSCSGSRASASSCSAGGSGSTSSSRPTTRRRSGALA